MTQLRSTSWAADTLFVHGGSGEHTICPTGVPTVQPIYTSTTYIHPNAEMLDQAFRGELPDGRQAYIYSRHSNPNSSALENILTQAEKGVGAVTFGSGMAAIHAALLASGLGPGKKIVAAQDLYGLTIGLLRTMFIPVGVKVVLRNLCCGHAADIIRAEKPDVVYVETLSNPLVKVTDLDAVSAAAQEVGAVTVVDSTFTTPYLVRPIEHGFDLVVHSATKYLGGHGDSSAGIVISRKHTLLEQVRCYNSMLGAALSPFETHLIMRGLKTLPLRMERQSSNALQVAHFLEAHPAVERVHYPGLPGHPHHQRASKLLQKEHYGGLLSFELKKQTRQAAFDFMDRLQLILPAATLGDIYSMVSYPPMSSHRGMTGEELQQLGITEGCIRLSVGIEDIRDIVQDLEQALAS